MKILHTADIHLKADDEKTVAGLEQVLTEAADREVDLVTIGGDLFDSPTDAEALRPQLRDLLSDNPFDILAIPGNHDADVYREHLQYGNDLDILTDTPTESTQYGEVEFTGLPFTNEMDEELFTELQVESDADTEILLLHCTLDIGFHSGAAGEEEGQYFPVTQATLADLGYDYILAGHIHSTDRAVPLDNGGTFIYPGSPVSHSTSETGRRNAVLIDTDADDISTVALDTFYHDSESWMVRPGEEEAKLLEIEDWVERRADDNAELAVHVDGFIDRDEDDFHDDLLDAAGSVDDLDDETRSATPVLNHPLYERFEERLAEREDVEDEDEVETRVIGVLSKLLAENKVQGT